LQQVFNDLMGVFQEDTLVSVYADDLALAVSHRKKETATERMQMEVNKVARWAEMWRLTLDKRKSKVCLFTSASSERSWVPRVTLMNTELQEDQNPVLLGEKYDKGLTLTRHTEDVKSKMAQKNRILSTVVGATWGWKKASMRTVYTATQRSLVEYAAPDWTPWLSRGSLWKDRRGQPRGLWLG